MAGQKEIASLTGHSAGVRGLAFSPDGKTLASGAGDHTIRLWDVAEKKEINKLKGQCRRHPRPGLLARRQAPCLRGRREAGG